MLLNQIQTGFQTAISACSHTRVTEKVCNVCYLMTVFWTEKVTLAAEMFFLNPLQKRRELLKGYSLGLKVLFRTSVNDHTKTPKSDKLAKCHL